jgi:hypothetical protein
MLGDERRRTVQRYNEILLDLADQVKTGSKVLGDALERREDRLGIVVERAMARLGNELRDLAGGIPVGRDGGERELTGEAKREKVAGVQVEPGSSEELGNLSREGSKESHVDGDGAGSSPDEAGKLVRRVFGKETTEQ